ncbi:MAG: YdcF family protein [Clostridia bacterium]|nr:YdcF family protein [Clostridia bacterium]
MKTVKKLISLAVMLAFVAGVAAIGLSGYVKLNAEKYILEADEAGEGYDCILVLGCKVNGDSPSLMLRDRLSQGVELYHAGASDRLLMSGDHGKDGYDEVGVMKEYAIDAGVETENIFEDHAGFSTYESMYRARDIFKAKKILIVTQEYHLYRAVYDARALGLDAYGVVAEPSMNYGGQIYRDIREIFARDKDFFFSLIQPKPTYLGEAIPISGNGEATQG